MRTLAALTLAATPLALLAGTNQWTNIGPDAAIVYALVMDPHDSRTLYASTGDGVFKTSNGGASWSAVDSPKGLTWLLSLAIDPQNAGTLYAGLPGDRVYKSTDGGASWSAATGEVEDYFTALALPGSLAIDPQNAATLYAARHHGVYKSTDGGASWNAATAGLPSADDVVRMLAVHPANSDIVYAACAGYYADSGVRLDGGAYKSTDGGISWRAVNAGLPPQDLVVESLALDPKNPDTMYAATSSGMFKSTDGGENWSAANSGLPPLSGRIVSLSIDPQHTNTVYAALSLHSGISGNSSGPAGGVFKSTDGGASWASAGLPDSIAVVAMDPRNSSTLYAASTRGLGIRKSIDGAATWTPSSVGLRGLRVAAFAVDPQDAATVYAATNIGIFKTTDSGAGWSEANSGLPADEFGSLIRPASLAIDPQNPGTLYLGIAGRGIFKSTDGAASWSYSGLAGSFNFDQSLVVDPRNPGTVYAAGFSGVVPPATGESSHVFKSTDGGATWQLKGSFPSLVSLVTLDPQDSSVLYAADVWDGRTLFKSRDGGETWSPLATPPEFAMLAEEAPDIAVLLVDPQNPQTIYAGGGFSGLIKSTDGGDSWEQVDFGMPGVCYRSSCVTALAIDPSSNTVYAAYGVVMLKSTDGAVTWTRMDTRPYGSSGNGIEALTVDPRDPNTLFAATGDGVFAITVAP